MGNTNCCKPAAQVEEIKSEMKTDKKLLKTNNKIQTDCENIEDLNNQINKNPKYLQDNFQSILSAKDLPQITEIKSVLSKAPNLNIEIISSSVEPKGLILEITPLGLINGKRQIKDGVTYFGYETEDNVVETEIDYLIRPKEENYDERFIGKHFQIRFNPEDMIYYLKDLGHGFGTFIKINNWTLIKNNLLLNVGENYVVFTLGIADDLLMSESYANKNPKEYENMLNIKIFSGNIKHGVLSFVPSKSPFTLGRSPDCEILIDDSMLSRIHSTIEFRDGDWYINDGNALDRESVKKSTNGTWIYAFEEIPIEDKMTFKANHNLFICKVKQNQEVVYDE